VNAKSLAKSGIFSIAACTEIETMTGVCCAAKRCSREELLWLAAVFVWMDMLRGERWRCYGQSEQNKKVIKTQLSPLLVSGRLQNE